MNEEQRQEIIEYILSRIEWDPDFPEEQDQAIEELEELSFEELEHMRDQIDQDIRDTVNESIEELTRLGLVEVIVGEPTEDGDPFKFKLTEKGENYAKDLKDLSGI